MNQELSEREKIKNILEENTLHPIKKYGQNFLVDKNVLEKIIKAGDLSNRDVVLEVGAGFGILTTALAKKTKKVIAIEKDKKIIPILEKITKNFSNIKIVNADILSCNIKKETNFSFLGLSLNKKYKVIANVPYYITSPIIKKFLEEENKPTLLVLMVQKEVAERMIAKPPFMNLLAVSIQFFATPKIISHVSPSSFYPPPTVTSSIIKITPKKNDFSKDFQKKFFFLLHAGFSHPRKQLIKNLNMLDNSTLKALQLEKDFLIKEIKKTDINLQRRAETLTIEEWIKMTKKITQKS